MMIAWQISNGYVEKAMKTLLISDQLLMHCTNVLFCVLKLFLMLALFLIQNLFLNFKQKWATCSCKIVLYKL